MSTGGSGIPHPSLLQDTTRVDLEVAWMDREQEAAHLMAGGYRSLAASLRCYTLEIRLTILICQRLNLDLLPLACKTHDRSELIIFTGLWAELDDPALYAIATNWKFSVQFSRKHLNVLRYWPRITFLLSDADELDTALDDPQDGVLP